MGLDSPGDFEGEELEAFDVMDLASFLEYVICHKRVCSTFTLTDR
jgi:hypothetical protein